MAEYLNDFGNVGENYLFEVEYMDEKRESGRGW